MRKKLRERFTQIKLKEVEQISHKRTHIKRYEKIFINVESTSTDLKEKERRNAYNHEFLYIVVTPHSAKTVSKETYEIIEASLPLNWAVIKWAIKKQFKSLKNLKIQGL